MENLLLISWLLGHVNLLAFLLLHNIIEQFCQLTVNILHNLIVYCPATFKPKQLHRLRKPTTTTSRGRGLVRPSPARVNNATLPRPSNLGIPSPRKQNTPQTPKSSNAKPGKPTSGIQKPKSSGLQKPAAGRTGGIPKPSGIARGSKTTRGAGKHDKTKKFLL